MVIHMGIVATMFARYPKIIDFSCGFQSYLPSGACSRARRERSTSRSNSASRNSVSFILVSLSYPQITKITQTSYNGKEQGAKGEERGRKKSPKWATD